MYSSKQIVWAKPLGYPWWPAIVSKLPQNNNGTFKVLFINEDNYAILDSKSIRKYDEYYNQLSKNKTKKLQNAIAKANTIIENKQHSEVKSIKSQKKKIGVKNKSKHNKSKLQRSEQSSDEKVENSNESQHNIIGDAKIQKRDMDQENDSIEEEQSSVNETQKKKDQSLTPLVLDQSSLERQLPESIGRGKIQKIEGELHKIVAQFQANKIKQWIYRPYFATFNPDFLTCQQLLQSNVTRMIRYIIVRMNELQFDPNDITQVQSISLQLKNRALDYLTNTSYYDQHLKAFDRNKQNQAQAQTIIFKIIKKQNNPSLQSNVSNTYRIKKQNIQVFTEIIGQEIGKGSSFKAKQFINDLRDKKYDFSTKLTSKAASQRFAQLIINRYL